MTTSPEPTLDRPAEPAWTEFARAPLVPVALAVTVGLVVDRYAPMPIEVGIVVAMVGFIGWTVSVVRRQPIIAFLWIAFAGLAAAYHHTHRHAFAENDVGTFATEEPRLVRLRGVLVDDPVTRFATKGDPLEPMRRPDRDSVVVEVRAIGANSDGWLSASGLAQLSVERDDEAKGAPPLAGLRAGDTIELLGMLTRPRSPSNPGEPDSANELRDRRIRATVWVADGPGVVTRLAEGEIAADPVAALRRHATVALTETLPREQAGIAVALLLGDGSAMERSEWDRYIRTGVVHALAISGQHLAVLAGFLWIGLRVLGVRRPRGAWIVLVVIVGYAILTGLRPSGVRAAAMVAAVCGGLVLRRPVFAANSFALGWLAVVALNPTDPFALGCQLSFLSVFVLVWGVGRWVVAAESTPLQRVIIESRPLWIQALRTLVRWVAVGYAITLVIWSANAPLILTNQNLVSPVALLIGPPVIVCTSIALVAGFLLMLTAPLGPVALPFALATEWSLSACEVLVRFADGWPGGSLYVPGLPGWFLIGFYSLLAGVVLLDRVWARRCAVGLLLWVFVGLVMPLSNPPNDELRMTFLAVGKGGCTVIETPDGRCLVYDAGAASGPSAVRRVVAPYLWSRGIRRIDELFLSHADTDHFNGVAELLRRFPIGQVTLTPSFAEKPTHEVAAALLAIDVHHIPLRIAVAGERFTAGEAELEVLHPPREGPPGIENERSLVLHVRYAGHAVLLTGDLEKAGTSRLLSQPPRRADVLMAPHHGSRAALPKPLLDWAAPRLIVVNRGPPQGNSVRAEDAGLGVHLWDTHSAGAITLRLHRTGLIAESYRTAERVVIAR